MRGALQVGMLFSSVRDLFSYILEDISPHIPALLRLAKKCISSCTCAQYYSQIFVSQASKRL